MCKTTWGALLPDSSNSTHGAVPWTPCWEDCSSLRPLCALGRLPPSKPLARLGGVVPGWAAPPLARVGGQGGPAATRLGQSFGERKLPKATITISCYRGQTPLNPESLQNLLKKYRLKGFAKQTTNIKNLSEKVSLKASFLFKVSSF